MKVKKKQIILALDLSLWKSGFAFMEFDGKVIETGIITPYKYKNFTKDRYPISTIKNAISDTEQFMELITRFANEYDITKIVIEELNTASGGMSTIKALAWLHGFLLAELHPQNFSVEFILTSVWRSRMGARFTKEEKAHNKGKTKYDKTKITLKHVVIRVINDIYGTDFKLEDNDITDAIAIGLAYLKVNKGLQI